MLRNKISPKYLKLNRNRKIYSQNFLRNKAQVYHLVENSNINKDDTVIEIGPGKGIITKFLLKKAKQVLAIELDKELFSNLKEKFEDAGNLKIVRSDIKNFNLPGYKYKVFSNIPFNITSEIINKLLNYKKGPEEAFLIVQAEAAKRYIGNPLVRETQISLLNKPFFKFEIFFEFKPSDFDPVPNVKPVMLKITKRKQPLLTPENAVLYSKLIKYTFQNQSEKLKNSLKHIFTNKQFVIMSKELKFDIKSNASELTFQQWLGIFEVFLTKVPLERQKMLENIK